MQANQLTRASQFPPLEQETRPVIGTSQAAYYLTFVPGTLREQHMRGTYDPRMRPVKVGNKLLWPVAGIKEVLGVA